MKIVFNNSKNINLVAFIEFIIILMSTSFLNDTSHYVESAAIKTIPENLITSSKYHTKNVTLINNSHSENCQLNKYIDKKLNKKGQKRDIVKNTSIKANHNIPKSSIQTEAGTMLAGFNVMLKRNTENQSRSWNKEDYFDENIIPATTVMPKTLPFLYLEKSLSSDPREIFGLRKNKAETETSIEIFFNSIKNISTMFKTLGSVWAALSKDNKKIDDQFEDRSKRDPLKNFFGNNSAGNDKKDWTETNVSEGRYIKGDPLKGYYDFIITEGSYKFWAAFQLATAVLIIYSTFAAIYYSKVNPLVGDYDYVDYLGGGRSLSMDDVDFVDASNTQEQARQILGTNTYGVSTWSSILNSDWLPGLRYTVNFILQAIDKLPQPD